jgi:hypothetical protein
MQIEHSGIIAGSLFSNKPLLVAIYSLIVAQILKLVFYYFKEHRVNFRHLVTAGGMPSSHSSLMCGLATAIGLNNGWDSSVFAVSSGMAMIVMYDAAGVRRAAGRQARILNQMMEDLFHKRKFTSERLSELLGHTPLEVFAGAVLGVMTALLMN